jgi:predicted dehydrogenase
LRRKTSLKIAVVGLGKMGLVHACTLNILPDVELTALCDKSAMIRRLCQKIFRGAKVVDDLEKLRGLDLDAVYVTTPIPSHFFVTSAIYQHEIARSVFVEKTLASTYDEASKLSELAQSSKGTNMVGYMKRFSVAFTKGKDLLSRGSIGEVVSFDAYAYSSDFVGRKEGPDGTSGNRGGVLEDLGSHIIDLALWYFGDLRVDSAKLDPLDRAGCEDRANIAVSGSGGLEGHFDVSWLQPEYRMPEFGLTIRGTHGLIKVNDDEVRLEPGEGEPQTWYKQNLSDNVPFLLGAPEYYREDECFIRSSGGSIDISFKTASKVDNIIDQIQRARQGQ